MQINRTNYEAFVLDYLEGNLTPDARQQVEAFLLAHPDIQAECEDLMGVALPQDELLFEDKHQLKMEDDISRADWLMIRALDGEASPAEREELNTLLLDPAQARSFEALKMAVLRPEELSFEDKISLRMADHLTPQEEHQLQDTKAFPALQPMQMEAFDKTDLYFPSTIDWSNDLDLAAAYAEGDLPSELEVIARQKAADSPVFARNVEMLKQVRLRPEQLVFDGKSSLKQKEGRVILFTPMVRRAVAIAAVFVVTFGIWRPWENPIVPIEHASQSGSTAPQSSPNAAVSETEVASNDQNQSSDTTAQPASKGQSVPAPIVMPAKEDMAQQQQPILHKQEVDFKKDSAFAPALENPLMPEEDVNIAQVPNTPVMNQEYVPIPKNNALKPAESTAPVTLIAFLGDKLEERIEQSQVYSFLDKKKKEMFQSEEDEEPVRFERLKSASYIKQKLVLWGLEFERTKRKK